MEFHIYLEVITGVIIGFISAFLLPGFSVILQGACEIIQRRRKKTGPVQLNKRTTEVRPQGNPKN